MPLSPAEIVSLSRLLDEALALEPAERDVWLAALPAADLVHAARLREMLERHSGADADERLSTMPHLAADDEVARTGEMVGPYRLLREIGSGGMGSVWLAERADGSFKRQVALKLPRLAWGAGLAERMAREREIGMLLEHPNIARLYDAGLDARGRPFLALEYVDGQPLDAWCEARALDVAARLQLFLQVVRAVAYAHGRLVVHRDLKPSNVLVSADGQAHLLDFGIAKLLTDAAPAAVGLTQQHGQVLTPHYAAPEQVADEAVTVQSDVYSLGVLLYELLTGTLPIAPKRVTLGAIEDAILQGDAPLASRRVKDTTRARALRGEVDAILAKAMQREPARRYATADALAQDIERHMHGDTVSARPDTLSYRLRKALRRHGVVVTAAAAVLVAVLSGSAVAVVQAQRAARSAERERLVKDFVADVFRANSRVDPKNAALRPSSPQSLLEGGATLIQQRFAGQPELQAELFGVVGGLFSDMGAYKPAAEYSTRRIEALALLRADPNEQAKALLVLAQALVEDGKYTDAELRVRRARELSNGDLSLSLDATLLLAQVQWKRGIDDPTAALEQSERMLAHLGAGPSVARAKATFLKAVLIASRNRLDEALPIFQQAIDTALLSEGPLSLTAIDFRLTVSRTLAQTTHRAAAQQHFDTATAALRQLGGAHEVRAAFATAKFVERQRMGGRQITATEAITALERSRAVLVASSLPVPDWWLPQIDFWRGYIEVDTGDIAGGLPLLEANEAALRRTFETPGQAFELASSLGAAMMFAGRHDLAGKFYRESQQARSEFGGSGHPFAAFDYFLLATNLQMQGRTREAEALLEEAPHFDAIRGEGPNPDRYNQLLDQGRAQVRLAVGDARGALALLRKSTPVADQGDDDWAYFNGLRGEALCAAGERAEGLATLKPLAALAERVGDVPQAPWLARQAAVIGLCALGTGDRRTALAHASRARAAFTLQPGVSPYYKAPLVQLERALGLHLPAV